MQIEGEKGPMCSINRFLTKQQIAVLRENAVIILVIFFSRKKSLALQFLKFLTFDTRLTSK